MLPFYVDVSATALLQVLAVLAAAVTWLMAALTGRPAGV